MIASKSLIPLFLVSSVVTFCNVVAASPAKENRSPSGDKLNAIPDLDVSDASFEDFDIQDEFADFFFQSSKRRKMQQSSTTSTRVNIFQKLGESLGMTIVGCFLIALMPCLIWKNEGRHVDQLSRIDFCKNNAVAIDW
jgi:hypothetical protein